MPADLVGTAEVEGFAAHRSTSQQLEFWARLGMLVDVHVTPACRSGHPAGWLAAAAGMPASDAAEARLVANAVLDAQMSVSANATTFADRAPGRGVPVVVADGAAPDGLPSAGRGEGRPVTSSATSSSGGCCGVDVRLGRRLDLVVGPNGAGKSTCVELVVSRVRPGVPFVNADVIAAERWPEDQVAHGYDAAVVAAQARDALLGSGVGFVAETVASHPSKLDLVRRARTAGFHVHLVVVAVPVELCVVRVALRAASGGHAVPEDKIRSRYCRLWDVVAEMVVCADSAEVFDNSGCGPVTVGTFVGGRPVGRPRWPVWAPEVFIGRWPGTPRRPA